MGRQGQVASCTDSVAQRGMGSQCAVGQNSAAEHGLVWSQERTTGSAVLLRQFEVVLGVVR